MFVLGGTTGIGFGITENFAKHGAGVSVAGRKQETVDQATAALRTAGDNRCRRRCGRARLRAVGPAFNSAASQLGGIDVLVSGAAGNFNVTRAAYPHLTRPGAAVINISAPQPFIPIRYRANACAAKAGVDQLTRVLGSPSRGRM